MSSSIEDLLDSPEENVDFDINDEEEEALLNDNFEDVKADKNAGEESRDLEEEGEEQDEHDFLELDNTTDFVEDENEENVRQDRFQSERPQQVEVIKELTLQPTRSDFGNVRANYRGRRPQRFNFRNNNFHNQRRSNFQNYGTQNKRVLINPHFKGQVPIRNNVSLVWDKNVIKKPAVQVQPWTQTVCAPQSMPWIRPPPVFQAAYLQPQIPQSVFVPPVNNRQYFQQPTFQQPDYAHFSPSCSSLSQLAMNQYNAPYNSCLNPTMGNYAPAPSLQNFPQPCYNVPSVKNKFPQNFSVETKVCSVGPQGRKKIMNFESRGPRTNLQEIKVSDNIVCERKQEERVVVKQEKRNVEEDEEMAHYRELIEHQKKLREKVLLRKEERRKSTLLEQKVAPPEELLKTFVTVSNKGRTNLVVPSITVTKSNVSSASNVSNVAPPERVVQRVVPRETTLIDPVDKNAISSFLSNRKIIARDEALPDTSVVVISNLATGSTEVKLRKLCRGVGDVKKLVMSPVERQATIQFKSVASAHAFYKKYQRFMLDLSMIQVTLKESSD